MRLSPEEIEHFRKRETIAHDDATALCTKVGWEAHERALAERSGAPAPAVPNARLWRATVPGKDGYIEIECERFTDARAFARIVASNAFPEKKGDPPLPEVEVHELVGEEPAKARWQVRWAGSSLDARDPLHMVARRTFPKESFRRLVEIDFA